MFKKIIAATAAAATLLASGPALAQQKTLLNSSYDVARELFEAINPKFIASWKAQTGETLTINQSHAGSSRQAQAIAQGLKADVVTYNQVTDVNFLADRGFVAKDWQKKLDNNASPFYSTIAFLVRKGNPKNIKTWDDLVRDDVKLVFPNPKTSGNARYTYLGAWLYANQKFNGDEAKTKEFVGKLLKNVAVFDTGGRAATLSFTERNIGDVLLSFESEVNNIAVEFKAGGYQVVVPPVSVLAEFPVAVVDKVVDQKGTRKEATAYLQYLYTKEAQDILAGFNYRVHNPESVKANASRFPEVKLLNPEQTLGSWDNIVKTHFSSNGVLDQLLAKR
ncbi:sulfate ABC transporter substrate-binding protein [Pigmentiphaga soli]|uniref:Sulfate ABC transporter substrate-binding protein n=1 Tax=Pigmentiphaga soli TaxID=1007095 RepID=A0ABP8GYB1_9BURK